MSAVDSSNTGVGGSAAITSSNPLAEFFVIGGDSQIYGQKLDAQGNAIGSQFLAAPGQVLSLNVGHDGSGRPELFVVGLASISTEPKMAHHQSDKWRFSGAFLEER